MFSPYDTTAIHYEFQNCRAALCRLKKAEALMVLKTWGNAWATSYRFHEPVLLPCLFGCYHGIDKLAHYVVCPWLFKFVSLLRPGTSSNPLERIAMHNPTLENAKVVACTFSGYHAIKCTPHLTKIASTIRTDSRALFSTAVAFAEAFLASSHAMRLPCVCISTFRDNLEKILSELRDSRTVTDSHVGASLYSGQAPWPVSAEERRDDPAFQRDPT